MAMPCFLWPVLVVRLHANHWGRGLQAPSARPLWNHCVLHGGALRTHLLLSACITFMSVQARGFCLPQGLVVHSCWHSVWCIVVPCWASGGLPGWPGSSDMSPSFCEHKLPLQRHSGPGADAPSPSGLGPQWGQCQVPGYGQHCAAPQPSCMLWASASLISNLAILALPLHEWPQTLTARA